MLHIGGLSSRRHDIHYDDTQHNDIQHNGKNATLRIMTLDAYAECGHFEYGYTMCHYAHCRLYQVSE